MRIETTDDLIRRLEEVFLAIGVTLDRGNISSGMDDYSVMFTVPGKVKVLVQSLKMQTNPNDWDGESIFWFYKDDKENWMLALRSVPHAVLCIGSVISLHKKHLEKYS